MSYRDYLLKVVGVSEDCLFFVKGVWALGLDTCTAWFAFFRHAPGFAGLTLKRPANSPESEKMPNDDYHDRKSVVQGKRVSRHVVPVGRRTLKKTKIND